mmetsp:Transcript_52022/g.130630  ORF Transcript_52022/g.130630 Transcript_52022/m.130630 type:complete len:919 (-) Transcript_52022:666-3422(-)
MRQRSSTPAQQSPEAERTTESARMPTSGRPRMTFSAASDTELLRRGSFARDPLRFGAVPALNLNLNESARSGPSDTYPPEGITLSDSRRTLRRLQSTDEGGYTQVPYLMNADYLWDRMHTGKGVKVAIFDTGLAADHPHFGNVASRTDWTDENTRDDHLGHGTFVAGVVAGRDPECRGFAPSAELHIFRVFTNNRVSYTSWFLDAFNYAIHTGVDVLNLSIGGPDFLDRPFVEKVWELSANNVIVVSAIGNDGPLYGTLNNPADQMDVIGVGGVDFSGRLAKFSSRGMTTWELPAGYGRVKPDIVALGQAVSGSRLYSGCRTLSGTSVASPVVTGAITLLISTLPEAKRRKIVNPASMKQALVEGAQLVPGAHIYEQGMGHINLLASAALLARMQPRASLVPPALDLTQCPYMWPFCTQAIYAGRLPLQLNVTILNGMGVTGEIVDQPLYYHGTNSRGRVEVQLSYPEALWPWSGYLGVRIRVLDEAAHWQGDVEGVIRLRIRSPPAVGEIEVRETSLELPLKLRIIETPPRERRILWDQYHSLRYPSGYFPRDALRNKDEPFDWNADHPHTNFRDLYHHLRNRDYFLEVLGQPYTCFDAANYGTLLVVDPEEEFFSEEISKLGADVREKGLSVLVLADWYDVDVMKRIKFFDENTRQWWTPATGGANLPALNELLESFGISFGARVFDGLIQMEDHPPAHFASGAALLNFPAGGSVLSFSLQDQSFQILESKNRQANVAIAGMLTAVGENPGRISVFGDSSCVDNASPEQPCFWMLDMLLRFCSHGEMPPDFQASKLGKAYHATDHQVSLPRRIVDSTLPLFSQVLARRAQDGGPPSCQQLDFSQHTNAGTNLDAPVEITWHRLELQETQFPGTTLQHQIPIHHSPTLVSLAFKSYLIPYLVLCGVVGFLIVMALRR